MEEEVWKPVVGFEDTYEVSNHGRVRSVDRTIHNGQKRKGVMLRPGMSAGYPYVNLCRNGVRHITRVHPIVAAAFLGPCPEGCEINHIDLNKLNNCSTNLQYATPSENMRHAMVNGARRKDIPIGAVLEIREMFSGGSKPLVGDVAARYGVAPAVIHRVLQGHTYTWALDQASPLYLPSRNILCREDILPLLKQGLRKVDVARQLGRDPSVVTYAMRRTRTGGTR